MLFFFNDTATTEIYTLSLHDALPICGPTRAMFFTAGVLALERRALRIAVSPWAKVFRPWRHPSMRKNGARWGPRWRHLNTHSQEWLLHPNHEAKMPG